MAIKINGTIVINDSRVLTNLGAAITTSQGGTGLTAAGTSGNVLISDGTAWTSAPVTVNATNITSGTLAVARGGTGLTAAGTSGNVLISDGTTWTSAPVTVNATNITGTLAAAQGGTGVTTGLTALNATNITSGTLAVARGGTGVTTGLTALSATNITSGTLAVARGGTGLTSAGTSGNVLISNGTAWTSAPVTVNATNITSGTLAVARGGTGLTAAGTAGNVLTSDGTNWISSAGGGGGSVSWASITGTPTTVSGYGITDAVTLNTTQTITGNKTFTGLIQSVAYNITAFTSMYGDASEIRWSVSPSAINNVMSINGSGNFTILGDTAVKTLGTTWVNPSDSRLKDNIQDYSKGLQHLMQIRPRTWEFNGKAGTKIGSVGLGVVADEIMTVLPDTVTTYKAKLDESDKKESDIKRFDASEITWLLVNSVKELNAQVESLRSEIAQLKNA